MSKGYLVLAQNSEHDYLRMAYALALSIKNTQTVVNQFAVAVEAETVVPEKYMEVFDHVVRIPWNDDAKDATWKINNQWKFYWMTPFNETVILDTDMIFTSDISYWWKFLKQKDVWTTSNVKTFRNELVTSDYYRKTFTSNDLPSPYIAFTYFKKNQVAAELFKMMEMVFTGWKEFSYEFLDETRDKEPTGDVALGLAIKLLGMEDECLNHTMTEIPTFVHMKSFIQNIPKKHLTEDWTKHIPSYMSGNGELKIGNFLQTVPFHYHIKEWLTDEIIEKLESVYERNRKAA